MSTAGPRPRDEATGRRLARQARQNTAPEMALRQVLHVSGLRYRVHRRPLKELRREADIVFTKYQVAVFVDGCFWHRCPDHRPAAASNAEWWQAKLERNVRRDRETDGLLTAAGWHVVRVWEHEPPGDAARRVIETLAQAGSPAALRLCDAG